VRHQDPEEHRPAHCDPIASERNRYYTGKYMTPRDFTAEQTYFLSRHRLHNRLLHGWGVVCGLRVVKHPKPECADRWVVVRAGVAIDCCGRELVLEADEALELPLPTDTTPADTAPADQAPPAQQPQPEPTEPPEPATRELFVCLRYVEQPTEHAPALYNEGRCDPPRIEANRWREVASVEVCPPEELKPGCWRVPQGGRRAPCRDDCGEPLPGPAGGCLQPDCPCGQTVPLARIVYDPEYPARYQIDTAGRRTLPTPPDYLTHITWCNWPHGGELTLSELLERDRRLEIRFDRRLLAPADQGEGSGINQFTYVVQYGNLQRDLEFLSSDGEPALDEEDGCLAVFTIDEDNFRPRSNLAGNDVFVTLKCDFVLDCHENPVDGDHLRGRLPSGNGTPGGLFESWFRVVPDRTGKGA
jgi:hypothetical protein